MDTIQFKSNPHTEVLANRKSAFIPYPRLRRLSVDWTAKDEKKALLVEHTLSVTRIIYEYVNVCVTFNRRRRVKSAYKAIIRECARARILYGFGGACMARVQAR